MFSLSSGCILCPSLPASVRHALRCLWGAVGIRFVVRDHPARPARSLLLDNPPHDDLAALDLLLHTVFNMLHGPHPSPVPKLIGNIASTLPPAINFGTGPGGSAGTLSPRQPAPCDPDPRWPRGLSAAARAESPAPRRPGARFLVRCRAG